MTVLGIRPRPTDSPRVFVPRRSVSDTPDCEFHEVSAPSSSGDHATAPIDLAEYFESLAQWWQEATAFLSSPSERADHPAFKKIVALGKPVLPHIFQRLEQGEGGAWYVALRRITGESPVPPEAASSSARVRAIWLDWGREHGYR